MSDIILTAKDVCKTYQDGSLAVDVLKGLSLSIQEGDRIAIIGPSGCGKSTLLHLLGGLDHVSNGEIKMAGIDWKKMSETKKCQLRNRNLGFVYQFHHLLPEFSALENVMMPLLIGKMTTQAAKQKAVDMLSYVGLGHRMEHKPAQLSGGERQRVAIARALVHQPRCVLADEPTGNLDEGTASKVFDLMLDLNQRLQTALVIVTHDHQLARKMDRVLSLHEGQLLDAN